MTEPERRSSGEVMARGALVLGIATVFIAVALHRHPEQWASVAWAGGIIGVLGIAAVVAWERRS